MEGLRSRHGRLLSVGWQDSEHWEALGSPGCAIRQAPRRGGQHMV